MSIIDLSHPTTSPKLFLGSDDGVVRIDNVSSEIANRLKSDSEGNTWFSKEVDFGNDSTKFQSLPDVAVRMFRLNIGYQTVMDSGASNGYLDVVSKVCTDPTWRMLYRRIGMEETIHAESYSYGLNQLVGSKSTEFLNIIYSDPVIRTRMNEEIDAFDLVKKLSDAGDTSDEMKKALLSMIIQLYLLEGIKFPFSFFVSFTINKSYNNSIQGFTRLLRLIAHDEFSVHVVANLHAIKVLREDHSQGFSHLFSNGWFDQECTRVARLIHDQELSWNKYLLSEGSIPGYNEAIGEHFIKYWTNTRLRGVKVAELFPGIVETDIIRWYNTYRDIKNLSTALQEASNISYIKGGLLNDMTGEW